MLAQYLGMSRGQKYEPVSCDGSPGITLLVGKRDRMVIAVERQELRRELVNAAGAQLAEEGKEWASVWHSKSLFTFALLIARALESMMRSSRLLDLTAHERLLLVRNRLEGTDETWFCWAPLSVKKPPTIDHVYLIARGRLLELD